MSKACTYPVSVCVRKTRGRHAGWGPIHADIPLGRPYTPSATTSLIPYPLCASFHRNLRLTIVEIVLLLLLILPPSRAYHRCSRPVTIACLLLPCASLGRHSLLSAAVLLPPSLHEETSGDTGPRGARHGGAAQQRIIRRGAPPAVDAQGR